MKHLSRAELEAGLDAIRAAPTTVGTLSLIVRRPAVDERESVDTGVLDLEHGLIGDNWLTRGSKCPDGLANPDQQITVMSIRAADLVAVDPDRRPW
ncbi:MAG TPA: MOSC domain-containing protein, partial [Actinomycetota bacterium]|nr:MOSC domain-containing protein [Actinomycetota bacterium]